MNFGCTKLYSPNIYIIGKGMYVRYAYLNT